MLLQDENRYRTGEESHEKGGTVARSGVEVRLERSKQRHQRSLKQSTHHLGHPSMR